MKKIVFCLLFIFLVISIYSQELFDSSTIRVNDVGTIRFGKYYEVIFKNLYCHAPLKEKDCNPIRVNDTIIFAKLYVSGIKFDSWFQFNHKGVMSAVMLRHELSQTDMINLSAYCKEKYGHSTKKERNDNGFIVLWETQNVDITLTVDNQNNEYSLYYINKELTNE